MKKNNFDKDIRIYYFDYLRIISSFSVILIHISGKYYGLPMNSYKWKIAYCYEGLSRFAVPNFFMISGTLFLNRDLSIKILFVKYIKRILIHLLFWSTFYSLFYNIKKGITYKIIIFSIIKGGSFHLWYLFAIIGQYIIVPFSRKIIISKTLLNYYIFLSFILLFIIPNYLYILSYYSKETLKPLNYIISKLNLNNFSIINFYFIFGYFLNNKEIKQGVRIIIYIIGIIAFYFTTIISYNFSIIQKRMIRHKEYNYLSIFFMSICVFIFFKNNFNNLQINKIKNNIFQKIAYFSFGIYLIHPFIKKAIMEKIRIFSLNINMIVRMPFIGLLIFILSLIISILIKYIPFLGKYII